MGETIINYYLMVNAIVFLAVGLDKIKAKQSKWRTKEKTLHFLSFIGGAFGLTFGMILFRHKTQKTPFIILAALATAFHISIIVLMTWKGWV